MTESAQIWNVTRKYLGPFGFVRRLENRIEEGWSDCIYILKGVTGFIELKLIPASGRCPDHFTREQLMFGESVVAAGGRWWLLARRGPEWLLLNVEQARAWFNGEGLSAVVQQTGRFPLKEILNCLTR